MVDLWMLLEEQWKMRDKYIPLLGPAAFFLISLVGTSPLYVALMSSLHPGQNPIQAHTIICVLLEHVPRKSPTWVISLSQIPCLLPRRPAAWGGSTNCHMGIFLTVVSCQPGACQSLLLICSKACFAVGDAWQRIPSGSPSSVNADGAWGKHFHNETGRQSTSKGGRSSLVLITFLNNRHFR